MRWMLIVLATLAAAAPAAAFEQGLQEGQAAIGVMLPMGDFGDFAETGFMFGAGYGYYVAPQFEVGAQFDYHLYGTTIEDTDGHVFSYRAFGKYALTPGESVPYLKGLLGLYSFGLDDYLVGDMTVSTDTQTDFGLGVGVGYQYRGENNLGFFGEAVFNVVFNGTDDETVAFGDEIYVIPGNDNSTFLNLRLGISLYWGGHGGGY